MTTSKPERLSSPWRCGNCGNIAPMAIEACYSAVVSHDGPGSFSLESGDIYELLVCPSCKSINLRCYFWHEDMESEADVTFRQLYPHHRAPLGMPPAIHKAYEAACRVKAVDCNAFGVLIGRTIEMVCTDRSAGGRFLSEKLKDLAGKGEIPGNLVSVAESLAKLRNVGAHADLGELTEEEVPVLEDLCRALLEYVYTAPCIAKMATERVAAIQARRGMGAKEG
jgi:hypothetical protein